MSGIHALGRTPQTRTNKRVSAGCGLCLSTGSNQAAGPVQVGRKPGPAHTSNLGSQETTFLAACLKLMFCVINCKRKPNGRGLWLLEATVSILLLATAFHVIKR